MPQAASSAADAFPAGPGDEFATGPAAPPKPAPKRWTQQNTKELTETAMLAACTGLAYFLSSLLRVESYLGTFFPLPVVIAAARNGPVAARKTMVATCLLLAVIAGPLRASTYFLMHGK